MKLRITVEGKSYEVDVDVLEGNGTGAGPAPVAARTAPAAARPAAAPAPASSAPAPTSGGSGGGGGEKVCLAPISGNITQIKCAPGDHVKVNQPLLVMEAMKMESNIPSPVDGVVKAVKVTVGQSVKNGELLVELA
ncbi:MAG: biotin/lipoyl-containing protein [Phycisphaeraceae bacterium]